MSTRAWLLLFSAALVIAMLRLGWWQLDRAAFKRQLYAAFQAQQQLPAVNIAGLPAEQTDLAQMRGRKIQARGQYLGHTVFLDNQSYQSRPGYFVYQPFMAEGSADALLVNRGWVALPQNSENRTVLPSLLPPPSPVSISGRLAAAPARGITLAGAEQIQVFSDGRKRVQYLDYAVLGQMDARRYAEITVQLHDDGHAAAGLIRDWRVPGSDEKKHVSYAVQWFALAFALALLTAWQWQQSKSVRS